MNQPRQRKDPRYTAVQINFQVPYAFREFLVKQSEMERISMSQMIRDCLDAKYGHAYETAERSWNLAQSDKL